MKNVRCRIVKYDVATKKPPYTSIVIDEVSVVDPELDDLGHEFCMNLIDACINKGHTMLFYTSCSEDENFEFDIFVALSIEEWPYCTDGKFNCYCNMDRPSQL